MIWTNKNCLSCSFLLFDFFVFSNKPAAFRKKHPKKKNQKAAKRKTNKYMYIYIYIYQRKRKKHPQNLSKISKENNFIFFVFLVFSVKKNYYPIYPIYPVFGKCDLTRALSPPCFKIHGGGGGSLSLREGQKFLCEI